MYTRVSRVIGEYVLWTEAVEYSIKGRILEHLDAKDPDVRYGWEISHHYKPSVSAAATYHPSVVSGATVEVVTALMLAYLRGFQNIDVVPNPRY